MYILISDVILRILSGSCCMLKFCMISSGHILTDEAFSTTRRGFGAYGNSLYRGAIRKHFSVQFALG